VLAGPTGMPMTAVPFDDLVDTALGNGGPILYSSRRLHLVDEIVGEFQELEARSYQPLQQELRGQVPGDDPCRVAVLEAFLCTEGFAVECIEPAYGAISTFGAIGKFRARRERFHPTWEKGGYEYESG
jgi:hypothetical protein